jgi:hypothetical protein
MSMQWIDEKAKELGVSRSNEGPWLSPTESDFDRLEKRLGARLPDEYRYFLSRYGDVLFGNDDSAPSIALAEPSPWGASTEPETFYSLSAGAHYGLEDEIQTFADRLPKGVIPISSDAGGNQICLDVAGEFPGYVWFWDHEQRWLGSRRFETIADELERAGVDTHRMTVHDIVREWARRHPEVVDRPADYMGMYRIAASFAEFLRALKPAPYGQP